MAITSILCVQHCWVSYLICPKCGKQHQVWSLESFDPTGLYEYRCPEVDMVARVTDLAGVFTANKPEHGILAGLA